MEKSIIYTRGGDKGKTSLYANQRVKKNSRRIRVIGSLDELNACLGIVSSALKKASLKSLVESKQRKLFEIGAELADPNLKGIKKLQVIAGDIEKLEREIDLLDSKLVKLRNFILPGGSFNSSVVHYARTVCRRLERDLVEISEKEKINPEILKYFNRFSDFLFVLARTINKVEGKKDQIWK